MKIYIAMSSGCSNYIEQNKLINELLNKSTGKSVVVDENAEDTFLAAYQSIANFEGKSEPKTRTSFKT